MPEIVVWAMRVPKNTNRIERTRSVLTLRGPLLVDQGGGEDVDALPDCIVNPFEISRNLLLDAGLKWDV
jgi:hypothetical protein